eukprot:CAMPEP_0194168546 /NCGR_PEP_ID=MMETSP0154-20130528/3473_1 /TAXON_ID=1049557 /ORGANISM="Thalassiothrix antarctica, Strain L6-D1" /LENGTH=522 /DNA_ID=CAMNT_0038879709 /DNA_START=6 /DNA_END=1574 /DNA_ORIENTATION=+
MTVVFLAFLHVLPLLLTTNGFHPTTPITKTTKAIHARKVIIERGIITSNDKQRRFPFLFSTAAAVESSEETTASTIEAPSIPLSWDDLTNKLEKEDDDTKTSLVTLYRDTNGWCPFCERIWLLLRAKGIPYDEQLVPLQNKPDWYKALVPTTLVPAILIHEDNNNSDDTEKKNERRIVWESLDIMKALDESFPSTPRMVLDDNEEYNDAVEMNDRLTKAGFQYIYASAGPNNNITLTEEDLEERKQNFMNAINELDISLGKVERKDDDDSFFRLGSQFTGIDAIMIPTLERWRYQLPLTRNIDILENRPHLKHWFEAMESYGPYRNRVAGDAYSWTATNSMFLRYFGGGEDKPEVQDAIQRTDTIANQLTQSFSNMDDKAFGLSSDTTAAIVMEAATKLITNHEAILKDCTSDENETKSQKDITRASSDTNIDIALRYAASILMDLSSDENITTATAISTVITNNIEDELMISIDKDNSENVSRAMRTIAARTCTPRDMSAPAAIIFRGVLSIIADKLDGIN